MRTDERISELHGRYHIVFPFTIIHLIKYIIDKITERYWKTLSFTKTCRTMKRYDEKFHDISNYSRNLFDETDQYVPTNDKQITKGVIKTCFNKNHMKILLITVKTYWRKYSICWKIINSQCYTYTWNSVDNSRNFAFLRCKTQSSECS